MTKVGLTVGLVLALSGAAVAGDKPDGVAKPADVVKRYEQCWGFFDSQSWAKFETCYTDDAQSEQPGSGLPVLKGRADIFAKHHKPFAATFPDAKGDLQLILSDGKYALAIAAMTGTQKGALMTPDGRSIPATNKKFGLLAAHMIEVGPGNAVAAHDWLFLDSGTMLSQLGLVPIPHRNPPKAAKHVTVLARGDAAEKANQATYNAMNAAFNKHDAAGLEAVIGDDVVWHMEAGPGDTKGKKDYMAGTAGFWAGFSDVKVDVPTVWGAGDYVVGVGTLTGTNDGEFAAMGLHKSGKKMTLPFLEVAHFEKGKLKEDWLFLDGMNMAGQLGLIPPAK